MGNPLHALLLSGFFLALTAASRRHFLYVAVPTMLAMLVYIPVVPTLRALGQSNLYTIQHFDTTIHQILTSESGREVLPLEVQQMFLLLRARHIAAYRVSDQILQDFQQRMIEGLWPARLEPAAPYFFRLNTDPGSSECRVLAQRRNVILERCR